jgi:SAM-dependent methyltransferase
MTRSGSARSSPRHSGARTRYFRQVDPLTLDETEWAPGPAGAAVQSIAAVHHVAVALLHLQPDTGCRILDLGASTKGARAWFAEVGLDVVPFVCGDGECETIPAGGVITAADALPAADAAFDHAVCLNLLHRVETRGRVLKELHRVLRPGARAVIAAPGGRPRAPRATDDGRHEPFSVTALLADCTRSGFAHPRLRPLSYVIPGFEVGRGRWTLWDRYARSRHTSRNWERVRRALSDALALGRRQVTFEDALGIELIRLLKGAMERYPLIVLTKSD